MLLLSFSGLGKDAMTLKSLEVLQHHKDVETFDTEIIPPSFKYDEKFDDVVEKMLSADVIIWAVSPYHMNIPSHMLEFFERCHKANILLRDSVNTYFITSMHVCDTFLTTSLEAQIRGIADIFVPGLSYTTPDMINRKMALYTLGTPDQPPKKPFLGKKKLPEFQPGEGMIRAVQWYKMLKKMYSFVSLETDDINIPKKVAFVDMDETNSHSQYVLDTVRKMINLYDQAGCTVDKINQRDYDNVRPCDGCKICYASKVCKIKDDYLTYEKRLNDADIVIYYGKCVNGNTSYISKRMVDRGVKNGLMPLNGKTPDEVDNFKAVGFILDANELDYQIFKNYEFGLETFNMAHFLGVLADIPYIKEGDPLVMAYLSLLLTEEKTIPQRNFYGDKIGSHFSALSQNIPSVIPDEANYYRRIGAYEPVPLDPNARTIMPDTYKIGIQMRQVPYNKIIETLDNTKE